MPGTLELEREQEFSILLVDDDQDWLTETVEFLQDQGLEVVDTARTQEEADSRLRVKDYDAVLADVELQPTQVHGRPSERGDDWLLERVGQIPETAIKAAVTADPKRIRDSDALEENGIRVAVKALDSEKLLFEEIIGEALKRRHRIGLRKRIGEDMIQRAADLFLEWINSRLDKASKTIWVGARKLSLLDIAEEVAGQTDVGLRFVEMFVSHMRLRIGLKNSSSPE